MKTICIKTNNSTSIKYILDNLQSLKLDSVIFSCHKFNVFNNIFIHYKGENLELFISYISNILTSLIFENYNNLFLKHILEREYFYFDSLERKKIIDIASCNLLRNIDLLSTNENIIFNTFYNYLKHENKLYLKGFLTFRFKKYMVNLENQIDEAVKQFLIEKEYNEFVSLLRLYVSSEKSRFSEVHLIYRELNCLLLDNNKQLINLDTEILNKKYLSDISFSSSDIILNNLLNILPSKIFVHLIDKKEDEFINTLKLIFENRVIVCNDCSFFLFK